jgi:urease accessory protein
MPDSASGIQYGAGFVLATALLHCVGIGAGISLGLLADHHKARVAQAAGGAMAITGIAMLSGLN